MLHLDNVKKSVRIVNDGVRLDFFCPVLCVSREQKHRNTFKYNAVQISSFSYDPKNENVI